MTQVAQQQTRPLAEKATQIAEGINNFKAAMVATCEKFRPTLEAMSNAQKENPAYRAASTETPFKLA